MQPALHLIAVVAQGEPGKAGKYRMLMPDAVVNEVYGWAREANAILFIDIQTGHDDIRTILPRFEWLLKNPDVHLGIDPEFYMHYNREGRAPGTKIGSMDARDVNYAIEQLAQIVSKYHLPPKVLIVHRFTTNMLQHTEQIRLDPRVQVVINMDGWGQPWLKFDTYAKCEAERCTCVGSISNPGSNDWEPVLGDMHTYPRVPHRALEIERLRTLAMSDQPLFLSEYGVGSGTHWPRIMRHYEAMGEEACPAARSIRDLLAAFMVDWDRWRLGDEFASPEDFFDKCLAKMAGQRKLGINALRSNPWIISYNLTGTHDGAESYSEGVFTSFREHKPGTFDAMHDVFAPLRWCLFAEPVSVYRGQKVKLEAVIANEDVLKPGAYPARLQVLGPSAEKVWQREVTVRIPAKSGETATPFAIPVFSEEVPIDGPSGKYQLTARLLKGAPASGESIEFYVTDPKDMPAVTSEIAIATPGSASETLRRLSAKAPAAPDASATTRSVSRGATRPATWEFVEASTTTGDSQPSRNDSPTATMTPTSTTTSARPR